MKGSDMKSDLYHRRLRDFAAFDEITLKVVPRYKTSGLSGDEWRTSVHLTFMFKGICVHESQARDMETAAAYLAHEMSECSMPLPNPILKLEESLCDQPGCSQKAIGRLKLKRLTSLEGEYLADEENLGYFRQFCLQHIERGDCSREDADENYIPLDHVSALDTQNAEESPSVFGGTIVLGGEETM